MAQDSRTISTNEAARRAGLTYRQVMYLLERIDGRIGSGNYRRVAPELVPILTRYSRLCEIADRMRDIPTRWDLACDITDDELRALDALVEGI